MLTPAVFGIKNSGLNLAANLMILFLVVIWLSLVYWTYADARRRIADPMLVGCAAAASLFPFVGTLVYLIVRPPEYLDDVRERELEIQAAEARLAELGYHLCPYCDAEVEKDFLRCPSCMRKLKDPCRACGRPLDPEWKICPFCEVEVGAVATAPRRTRRRREAAAAVPRETAATAPREAAATAPREAAATAPLPSSSRRASADRAESVREAAADGRSADGRSADGRSADGRTADGRSADGRTADGRSADARTADGRGGDRSPKPAERPVRAADRPQRAPDRPKPAPDRTKPAADRPPRAADRPPRAPQIT